VSTSCGERKVNEEGEGGQIRLIYFVYMYENMKPVEMVLRRERGEIKEKDGGVNLIKIVSIYINCTVIPSITNIC
jgi:hypothetical protein